MKFVSVKSFVLSMFFVFILALQVKAAVINDLAGPSDYGPAATYGDYSLAGLTYGDTRQGEAADCWWWATIASIVNQRPDVLSRNYQVQTDGTVNVTFYRSGVPITYHVTSDINTRWGNPYVGYENANGNSASHIMQKAFANFRSPVNTMADTYYGFPIEAINAFGLTGGTIPNKIASFAIAWAQGDIIEVDTGFNVLSNTVADHSYSVWSVDAVHGTAVIRSPWGDGYQGWGYDTFITVDDAWLAVHSTGSYYGQFGGDAPPSIPEPASLALIVAPGVMLLMSRQRRKTS